MMEPFNTLEIIKDKNIHHFFGFLPLLTFIITERAFWIIGTYTVIFAIWEVYILSMTAFKKQVTKIFLNINRKTKFPIKVSSLKGFMKIYSDFKKEFFFIWNFPLFFLTCIFVVIAFIYSMTLSIIFLNEFRYGNLLLLAHIFLITFMFVLRKTLNQISSNKIK
ncbi:hypothetical protein ACFLZZ_01095 [Nanoarchaeota archaeon]